jgi:hypothetical protein
MGTQQAAAADGVPLPLQPGRQAWDTDVALRNGPSWDRPSRADVIVRIVGPVGRTDLLRAPAQAVGSVQ